MHKFSHWLCKTVEKLSKSWYTKIAAHTKQGQGDSLCSKLFSLCINPIAWKLKATEGYKQSNPIGRKITHLLYIDDMKIFCASQSKLNRLLKVMKTAIKDIGLVWNKKKCAVAHVKKVDLDGTTYHDTQSIDNLKDRGNNYYKFLGILENTKEEDNMVLEATLKTYQQRLSVVWSNPLSDFHKVTATSQYTLPVLAYPIWTQTWNVPVNEL